MATHSSILDWRIPWTEESGGLQSMGSQGVRHNQSNLAAAAAVLYNSTYEAGGISTFIATESRIYQ